MKIKKIVVPIYLLLLIIYIGKVSVVANSIEYISSSIVKETKGKIIECGLRYELSNIGNSEESCREIFDLLSIKKEIVIANNSAEGSGISIEFHDDKIKGFIGYSQVNSKITVELVGEGNLDIIYSKKNKMDEFLKEKPWKVEPYEYLKVLSPEKDIVRLKGQIDGILKAFSVGNIESVEIGNGYCITGYTGVGNPIKNGNELIDINCAIRGCESGSYVIIGTPVISIAY